MSTVLTRREAKAEYDLRRRLADPEGYRQKKAELKRNGYQARLLVDPEGTRQVARDQARAYREANPEYQVEWNRANPDKLREYYLRNKYGLEPDDTAALLAAQDGACPGCLNPLGEGHAIHVDHCHDTGRVRGLLCRGCNLAIGNAGDDPGRLQRLVDYLV